MSVVYENQFDPDAWVLTMFRATEEYANNAFDPKTYEIIFSYPSANDLGKILPLARTIIHFEVDDIHNIKFGIGDNIVDSIFDEVSGTVTTMEAKCHEINFDIGIWASPKSGGTTSRMRAYQILDNLLNGAAAYQEMLDAVGIEIRSFTGVQFIPDQIGNLDVQRAIGITLVIRVYSRRIHQAVEFINSIVQDPHLQTPDGVEVSG